MSQPNETFHAVHDMESRKKGMEMVVNYLTPLVPKFTPDEFNQAMDKFASYTSEQQQLDQKKCEIIKNYLKSFNIYIDRTMIPSLEADPDRGPYAIEIANTIVGKSIFYCPRFNGKGNLYIDLPGFTKAMEVLSKPEALLLFR